VVLLGVQKLHMMINQPWPFVYKNYYLRDCEPTITTSSEPGTGSAEGDSQSVEAGGVMIADDTGDFVDR
jgi:hypothetical protein